MDEVLQFEYSIDPKGLRDKVTISWDIETLQAYWEFPTPYNFSYEKYNKERKQKEAESKLKNRKN